MSPSAVVQYMNRMPAIFLIALSGLAAGAITALAVGTGGDTPVSSTDGGDTPPSGDGVASKCPPNKLGLGPGGSIRYRIGFCEPDAVSRIAIRVGRSVTALDRHPRIVDGVAEDRISCRRVKLRSILCTGDVAGPAQVIGTFKAGGRRCDLRPTIDASGGFACRDPKTPCPEYARVYNRPPKPPAGC